MFVINALCLIFHLGLLLDLYMSVFVSVLTEH